jgi:hypothetical protein
VDFPAGGRDRGDPEGARRRQRRAPTGGDPGPVHQPERALAGRASLRARDLLPDPAPPLLAGGTVASDAERVEQPRLLTGQDPGQLLHPARRHSRILRPPAGALPHHFD